MLWRIAAVARGPRIGIMNIHVGLELSAGICPSGSLAQRTCSRLPAAPEKFSSPLQSALAQFRVASLLYPGRSGGGRWAEPVAQIAEIGPSPGGSASYARIANWVAETTLTALTPGASRDAMWWRPPLQSTDENTGNTGNLHKPATPALPRVAVPAQTSLLGSDGQTGQNPALYAVRKNYLARRAGSAVMKLKGQRGRNSGEEIRCR
jgi:hypothetical protein